MNEEKEQKLRREAEKEERMGKQNLAKKFFRDALVNFQNAEHLWGEAGDFAKAEEARGEIKRVKEEFGK